MFKCIANRTFIFVFLEYCILFGNLIVFNRIIIRSFDYLKLLKCLPDESSIECKDNAEIYGSYTKPWVQTISIHKRLLHSEIQASSQRLIATRKQSFSRFVTYPEFTSNYKITNQ